MSLNILRKTIRHILAEEIGRNFHTINTDPISYKDYVGYEVDVITTVNDDYILSITYENNKLVPDRKYSTREEAELAARQIVDKHRLSNGN